MYTYKPAHVKTSVISRYYVYVYVQELDRSEPQGPRRVWIFAFVQLETTFAAKINRENANK